MKKLLTFAFVVGITLGAFVMVPVAQAVTISTGDFIELKDSYGTLGGEFIIQKVPTLVDVISTFCLERNEYFAENFPYMVIVATDSYKGGLGGQVGTTDPLDPKSAYLFYNFLHGTLAGYDYTPGAGRVATANSLQLALWFIEDELPGFTLSSLGTLDPLAKTFVDDATLAGWTDIGNVRVLQLYQVEAGGALVPAQDVLYAPVPEPATMLLIGSGLVGLAGLGRRKFFKKA